ncbi:MAG TPA: MarR family winged helix-turn-helix transcriptional regulator [Thermomicrobiales bacterium]|nr:MarR family winged helix-turn-helix transcriptional regulator [Thermomicrobiales bacterium]
MGVTAERAIVDLFPQYAHRRRAGWAPASITHDRVTLPEYLLLRRVAIERIDVPIPFDVLRHNVLDPYSTADPFLDGLPRLVDMGLLDQSGNEYTVTSSGTRLLALGERAANDYAASRVCLPPHDLAQLASMLDDLATRLHRAPEPAIKSHQDRVPLLRRFDPRRTPSVRLEYALYALQRARDDAHISAWRTAGFRGPEIEVLSHVWNGDASTASELVAVTRNRLHAVHVAELIADLVQRDLISHERPSVALTERGREVRDAIERETDRVYFAPWQDIDAVWIRDRLERLTAGLTD